MKWCKPFWKKHDWKRYSEELIEQLFTGGYYSWFQCQKCLNIKFDKCDKYRNVEVEYQVHTGPKPE
jgi:hypothetical protein